MPMRRESSTVVALVGAVGADLQAGLTRSPNVTVARAPAPDPAVTAGAGPDRPGWEPGALAMREAARRRATYVVVADDPLAAVAAAWRAMWSPEASPSPGQGAADFELRAAEAITAWRENRFLLPDYYLVMAPALEADAGPDLYLGPLRAMRPHRVTVAGLAAHPAESGQVLDALRALEHGPWWPPLDELIEAARTFYAGGLTPAGPATVSR
jgi:hypothetical protein